VESSPSLRSELTRLIERWRLEPEVLALASELETELGAGSAPFVGRPIPERIVGGRLPPPIVSAWVFVLRPRTLNPAHVHPNSTQFTAAIRGGGKYCADGSGGEVERFDPERAQETLLVFPPGTAHAFEPGGEPLVVLSFHTVAPDELIEIEVQSGAARRYVQGSGR
jgi:hypothetical protein